MRTPVRAIGLIATSLLLIAGCGPPNYVAMTDHMAPTIERGDIIAIDRRAYTERTPGRGEIVGYHAPDDPGGRMLIGRVVATGGDSLRAEDGPLLLNDEPVEERYLAAPTTVRIDTLRVPDDHAYILGDNRDDARDSRAFGPVPVEAVIGRIVDVQKPPGSDVPQ